MARTRIGSIQLEPTAARGDTEALRIVDSTGAEKMKIGSDGLLRSGLFKKITATVGTSETEVEHGLGRAPIIVIPVPRKTSAAYVNLTKAADETKVYLIASAASTTVDIYLA